MDSTTGGPIVRLGTKWPSITSRWSMVAPPRSTRAISSARRAKSAERIEGTISIMCGLNRSYHSGKEAVPRVAARKPPHRTRDEPRRNGGENPLVLFGFERAGGVDQQAIRRQDIAGTGEEGGLAAVKVVEIGRGQAPLDFGIPAKGAGARAGGIEQNAVERLREGKGLG